MSLKYSRFLYGWQVISSGADQNNKLDFVSNGTTYAATIPAGIYCPAEFAQAVQDAMQSAGEGTETCTFSFSTSKFTLGGPATFSLEWSTGANAGDDCSALLGFDNSSDSTGATSYESDSAAGGTHSSASLWTMAEPNVPGTSPVDAQADGTAAKLLRRRPRTTQNTTDGGYVETTHHHTLRTLTIGFRALTTSEQTNMEAFLDWAEKGRRFNWAPDKDSPGESLRLVMRSGAIPTEFEWETRDEVSWGELEFIQQLSRT